MGTLYAHKIRIAAWAVLVVLVVVGFQKLHLNGDILRLLPRGMTEVQGLKMLMHHFSKPDELIVTIRGEDPDEVDDATAALAGFYREQTDLVKLVVDHEPWEDDASGMAELIAYSLLNKSPEELSKLVADLGPGKSAVRLEETLSEMTFAISPAEAWIAGFDAFGLIDVAMGGGGAMSMMDSSAFCSEDGTMRVLYVRITGADDRSDYRGGAAKVNAMKALRDQWLGDNDFKVQVNYTGEPAFSAEISSGMESDMRGSAFITLILVGLIFFAWYRQHLPLMVLLAMLVMIFTITLALGGFLIGEITAMNVGFASILIGLSVDYGILIYQGTILYPGNARMVRQENQRGIIWAGATTAVAFGSLMASSLPGVSELGLLVGAGIGVGAVVMLVVFSALMESISRNWRTREPPLRLPRLVIFEPRIARKIGYLVLGLVVVSGIVLIFNGAPKMDASDKVLRPRTSEAYDTMDMLTASILGSDASGSIIVKSDDAGVAGQRLQALDARFRQAQDAGEIQSYVLPLVFVPDPAHQQANLNGAATQLMGSSKRLYQELFDAGFSEAAEGLLRGVFASWEKWRVREGSAMILPESAAARWMLDRMIQVTPEGAVLAIGGVTASPGTDLRKIQGNGVFLADWSQAMLAMRNSIPGEVLRILVVLVLVVIVMLWLAFRHWQDIGWVVFAIGNSLILVLGVMSLLGWTWNFFNMAALLLTLGAGLDYSIHMLLGFRREKDVVRVQQQIGQALLVCALSTVAGFATLSTASYIALASLGKVCALALFLNALVAIFLLPLLWGHTQQLIAKRDK